MGGVLAVEDVVFVGGFERDCELFLETVDQKLAFERDRKRFAEALALGDVLLLQFDAVCHVFAVSAQMLQLLKCSLKRTAVGWVRLQTDFHQLDEAAAEVGTVVGERECNSFSFEGGVIIGVIILAFFERDEFEYDHGDGKDIGFVDIVLDVFVHVLDLVELLRCQNELLDECFVLDCSSETTMPVLGLEIVEVEFEVALGAEEYGLAAILADRYVIVLEVECEI